MKIRGWEIDGFGVLRDVAVRGLPDGLTVVHGANEAGKSTLLEFLRRMLFGLPADAAAFAPLYGGEHGGRLLVAGEDGDYVVARDLDRRAAPSVRRPDGSAGGSADLVRLLAGADEALFRAVFAFSLDDLQSLAGLDADGARAALFSASLAGAGRAARGALATLRGQAAARLNGDGPAPIAERLAALHALRPRLAAARHAALAYPDLRHAEAAARAARAAVVARLETRRSAAAQDAALLRAWPLWQALAAARAELAALPAPPPPPAVDAELTRARELFVAARGAAEALAAEQAAAAAQLAALPRADAALPIAAELEALCADLTLHRFQLATLPVARARAEEAEATWQARRERLVAAGAPDGDGADETALRDWARLGVDREQVRDWQARLQASEERLRQARRRAEAAAQQAAALGERAAAIEARLPARQPLGAAEVDARQGALAELRAAVEAMLDKRDRGEAMAQALREKERALRALEAEADAAAPAWALPLLAGAGVAAALAAVWSLAIAPLAALLAALVALGAGAGAWRVARARQAGAVRVAERERARRALRSELEAARRGRDQAWHAAAELAEQIARDGEALGLPRSPTPAELERAQGELAADDAARATGAAVRAERAELEPALRAAEASAAARAAERAAAEVARDDAQAAWQAWAARAGVGPLSDAQLVLDRVAAWQSAHEALLARDAAARELRQLAPMVAAWEARARVALARGGAGDAVGLGGEALTERVVLLRARTQEAAPLHLRRAALEAEVAERAPRLAALEAQRAHAEAALAEGLAHAGVRDDAELAARRAQAPRRAELERLIAERAERLAERIEWEGAEAALASGAVETWRARGAAADAELPALEAAVATATAEEARAAAACAALETSDELPGLELEWVALTAELDEAVRDWRLLAAADGLLDAARHEFERSRQPAVLREASHALAAVTGGRYLRVVQDERGEGLLVVERDGQAKPAGEALSRGTTEQLYLAVRLGLAQALAARGTALPLVMDDVLVNFDPERARAMAAVLGELAQRHQMLFFTCHPAIRDLLVGAGQAARVVEL